MPSLLSALAISCLATRVFAIPNVTAIPLPNDCTSYPQYDNVTGIAGPWTIQLNSCDNSTIEGFGDNAQLIRTEGETGIHEGRISIVSFNQEAKYPLQCDSATGYLAGRLPIGVSGVAWQQVNISYYPYDAELGWGFGQYSTAIEPYQHELDGVVQDGVFLGQDGYTQWGVKWYDVDESGTLDGLPYWGLRLLGKDSGIPWLNGSALLDGEYRTFVKIAA